MKKLKKVWIGILACLTVGAFALCITACGSGGTAGNNSTQSSSTSSDNGFENGGEEIVSGITFNTFAVNETTVYGKVSNSTATFSFVDEVTVQGNATYIVDNDEDCNSPIESKTVDLAIGDNEFYVLEKVENNTKLYTVTIRRRPMYEVTFNVDGGTPVEKQTVEEDTLITAPNTEKTGYILKAWDYDFTMPITESIEITATWVVDTRVAYTVEYYLQNLENDEYTLKDTEDKKAEPNTTVNAEIKYFEHFTSTEQSVSGNIEADGSTVLKVYYTRNKYTVTFDGNGGTLVSGQENQTVKYGTNITAPVYERTGYTFEGFDKTEYTNISENLTVRAKWKANRYTLTIVYGNGQENKIITQDYNTPIESIANPMRTGYTFIGWDKAIPSKMPAENVIVTAKWKINQYTLTVVYGNGQENKAITQDYDTPIEVEAPNERAGYGFDWDKAIPLKMPAENMTVTAIWNAIYIVSENFIKGLTDYGKNNCTTLNIPSAIDGVKIDSIYPLAFKGCSNLISVTISEGITYIGANSFTYCTNLTSIAIPDSITFIAASAFDGCGLNYTIENGLVYLGNPVNPYVYLIAGENQNAEVTIENGCKIIGSKAFTRSDSLKFVSIPDSITTISSEAFYDCRELIIVSIGNGITNIGSEAFRYCEQLEYTRKDGLKYLGNDANPYLCLIGTESTYIETAAIETGCKVIGTHAFRGCDRLVSVTIPNSVTSIGEGAFYYCPRLTSIIIPDGVTAIRYETFSRCTALTSVVIPNSVTSIERWAFWECTSLTSIDFEGTAVEWNAMKKEPAWAERSGVTKAICSDGEAERTN